jgi:hypothetical protein
MELFFPFYPVQLHQSNIPNNFSAPLLYEEKKKSTHHGCSSLALGELPRTLETSPVFKKLLAWDLRRCEKQYTVKNSNYT